MSSDKIFDITAGVYFYFYDSYRLYRVLSPIPCTSKYNAIIVDLIKFRTGIDYGLYRRVRYCCCTWYVILRSMHNNGLQNTLCQVPRRFMTWTGRIRLGVSLKSISLLICSPTDVYSGRRAETPAWV